VNYYTYKVIDNSNSKKYIGKRQSKLEPLDDLGKKYFTSSSDKDFKSRFKQNPSKFELKILNVFENAEDATSDEIKWHKRYKVSSNQDFYNKSEAILGGAKRNNVLENTQRISYAEIKKLAEAEFERYTPVDYTDEWFDITIPALPVPRYIPSDKKDLYDFLQFAFLDFDNNLLSKLIEKEIQTNKLFNSWKNEFETLYRVLDDAFFSLHYGKMVQSAISKYLTLRAATYGKAKVEINNTDDTTVNNTSYDIEIYIDDVVYLQEIKYSGKSLAKDKIRPEFITSENKSGGKVSNLLCIHLIHNDAPLHNLSNSIKASFVCCVDKPKWSKSRKNGMRSMYFLRKHRNVDYTDNIKSTYCFVGNVLRIKQTYKLLHKF